MRKPPRFKHPRSADFIFSIIRAFEHGWFIMLAAGGLHSAYPAIPNFGYWWSVLIAFVAHTLVGGEFDSYDTRHNQLP